MAWWSIALLLLSIVYLTYNRSPAMWTNWLWPKKKEDTEDGGERTQEEDKMERTSEEQQEIGEEADKEREKTVYTVIESEEDGDATPQAKPLSSPSPAQVPSLTLDDSQTTNKDKEDDESEDERDNLPPPMFPAANSAQRASVPAPVPAFSMTAPSKLVSAMAPPPPSSKPPAGLMAPPQPPKPSSSGLMPPPRGPPVRTQPSTASSLRVPSTGPLPNRGPPTSSAAPSRNSLAPSRIDTPNSRNKVQLTPGHSPLDWATLARSKSLSNVPHFMRVTPSMLKHFNGRKDRETGLKKDAWSVYQGKVYNISPYLPFHPGGEGELLRGAGKDGTAMFNDVHPWVNWEGMLSSCLVGILVSETEENGGLDSLD